MQGEDDVRGLAKIMGFMRAVSILLMLMHFYWFCYGVFFYLGWTMALVNKILSGFQQTAGLFTYGIYTKIFALVLLALSCLGTKGVKNEKMTWRSINLAITTGALLFFLFGWLPAFGIIGLVVYIILTSTGYIFLMVAGVWMSRLLRNNLMDDVFNQENESFMQETRLIQNEYSVNLPTKFYYNQKWNDGWINIVNPFRATIVLGTPGSGKSFAVVNNYIRQHIEKGFSMYIYDFKFDDLSTIAYNHLIRHADKYAVLPKFYVINFDDPRRSHRCNPINPDFMTDISDAYESAYTIMLNLNRSWIQKQGDFFVESPIILLAAIIWFLKIYDNGRYCTFPHAIELLNKKYSDVFTILTSYPDLENYLSPFMDAWQGGAQDQLQGQIASAKIPLSRMISPQLYWVMTGDDFSLDINNPKEPKILCVGNNPDRQNIYSAGLIGHSFGGYQTNLVIGLTNIFAVAVSGAGISDTVGWYFSIGEDTLEPEAWRFENQQFRMGKSFYQDKQGYLNNSPLMHADMINTPLLLWCGKEDTAVDMRQSVAMHLALRRLNKKNALLVYPGQGHAIIDKQFQEDLSSRIREWFAYFLKDAEKPDWLR